MRRIIVIAAGPEGVSCATRIKRRLYEHEINIVIPSAVTAKAEFTGPAGRRFAALLPDVEALAQREIGVLETDDIMPDLEAREITVGSSRGNLTVRYSDMVLEVPATVRIPRPLQKADNVFAWPMPGFAASPAALDAALADAAASGGRVLVTGDGAPALEAVFLACEAGAGVHWLRTRAENAPALEEQLLGAALKALDGDVAVTHLPGLGAEELACAFGSNGLLERVTLPDGTAIELACAVWTGPLMARHPVLREEAVVLDNKGRIVISDADKCPGLRLAGSGSALEDARLPVSGACIRACPGGTENAALAAWTAVDDVTGQSRPMPPSLSVRKAQGAGLVFLRAGLSLAEAEGLDCEYACIALHPDEKTGAAAEQKARLALSVVCHKQSRTLLGVQAFSAHLPAAAAEAIFGMALAAVAGGASVDLLARRSASELPGRLLSRVARVICNKLDTTIQGISPAEFLASREAGAEFFTLDLRSLPDWKQGHVPGAYNIPLSQLKKRIQDEVPRFTPIVTVSSDGCDAYVAACRMAGLGAKDLYVLDGGMEMWPYELEQG